MVVSRGDKNFTLSLVYNGAETKNRISVAIYSADEVQNLNGEGKP